MPSLSQTSMGCWGGPLRRLVTSPLPTGSLEGAAGAGAVTGAINEVGACALGASLGELRVGPRLRQLPRWRGPVGIEAERATPERHIRPGFDV
jgi:hypothetical protein